VTPCTACSHDNPAGARFCNACGASLLQERVERRKTATLLFCDVAGSTALAERVDPEAVRELMGAYFEEMRAAIELHGGTVEKFIGDAVVGVFGVPVAHEDDALRAVRAGADMQHRLLSLNGELDRRYGVQLAIRIGVNTGEVAVGGLISSDDFVAGDAVNVAARLEQAASPGEILLGEATHMLIARSVDAEPLSPLAAKGKAADLHAYRLVRLREQDDAADSRRLPFVGREAERKTLGALVERVRSTSTPSRALVVGEAGVGKSRLVEAVLEPLRSDVRVLSVRCLPYGKGATYFPVVQLLRQAAGIGESQDASQVHDLIGAVLADVPDGQSAAALLAQVMGLGEGAASTDEIAWAVRRLVEALAADGPLVLLIDDVQWAQEAFVELVAGIAERARGPVLVLCLARPEFAAGRTDWPPDVRLRPLSGVESEQLIERLAEAVPLAAESRTRFLAAAGGNPLFLTELVAYAGAVGETPDVPPTLEALLTARLDARPQEERRTLECAAVEGQLFHRGAVVMLAAPEGEPAIDGSLERLVEDALIRVARSSFDNETAFEFHHLLVRDAAYRGTPKRRRAELHLMFASWLEEKLGARVVEVAEIVAYHLEQACRLRGELGPLDEKTRDVSARAAALLDGAARRSLAHGDAVSALGLLTRAVGLARDPSTRIDLSLRRGVAAYEAAEFELSEEVLAATAAQAEVAGLDAVAMRAGLELAFMRFRVRPTGTSEALRRAGAEALQTFARREDADGLAFAYSVLAFERWNALRCAESEELLEQALVHAERSRDERLIAWQLISLSRAVAFGPRHADVAAARIADLVARGRSIGPVSEANLKTKLCIVEATLGHADEARALARDSISTLTEVAATEALAGALQYAGLAELMLGEPVRAEKLLRQSLERAGQIGERGVGSTTATLLGRALVDLGELDDAERFASLGLEWASEDDLVTHMYARCVRALVLAARGDLEAARTDALAAVDLSSTSDLVNQRGDALRDLAYVLRATGDAPGAQRAAENAYACYLDKGNLGAAERVAALAVA
jgi:class 3 adenylate cyclase/tetratricopeptide (TPR) repeat protein